MRIGLDIDNVLNNLGGQPTADLTAAVRNEDTVSLIDNIIRTGMERRASDIHIEPLPG